MSMPAIVNTKKLLGAEKKIRGNRVGWPMANESRMMQEANEEALMEGILPIHPQTNILTIASNTDLIDREIEIAKRQESLASD